MTIIYNAQVIDTIIKIYRLHKHATYSHALNNKKTAAILFSPAPTIIVLCCTTVIFPDDFPR